MFEGLVQPMHLLLVLVITLLVFGPGKLPEIGKGLGEAIRDFRRALNGGGDAGSARPPQASVTSANDAGAGSSDSTRRPT
ncbi:MAG TPA: twin-arginine translocase TatA/TatE family subunit [Candidatus Binatia bacterium]|nr:twin-arginine translocase TatA/TatE family subunit [Candidatus Binatia bacterium]